MYTVLAAFQVFLAVGVIFLILMHSGKDAGLSGAFGVGTGAGPFGGGSLVERNLNRWTVFFAVLWGLNSLILLHSGKDAGLSGAFGVGTGAGPFGGGSLVERNLNRWTVFFALLFVANVIVLLKI